MRIFGKKGGITVAPPPQQAAPWVIPPEHVKITCPDGASQTQLCNSYAGQIVNADKHCPSCYGDGYVRELGVVQYCKCRLADRNMNTAPSSSHKQSES